MSKKANPAIIGAFVLAALIVAAAALALLGSGHLFKRTSQFVLYFDGSLSGLDVGAPVEYRGVRVGAVSRIILNYNTESGQVTTPVYVVMEADRIHFSGGEPLGKGMDFHIGRGLRGQLQSQSLVTGKLKVMLLDRPDSPVQLMGGDEDAVEIPTIPTLSESLAKDLEKMPLAEIVRNLNTTMDAVARATTSEEFSNTTTRLAGLMKEMETLGHTINQSLPPVLTSARQNADEFVHVQREMREILQEVQQTLSARSPERQQFLMTMRGVEEAAVALRDLLAYLQVHPESLITGKKE